MILDAILDQPPSRGWRPRATSGRTSSATSAPRSPSSGCRSSGSAPRRASPSATSPTVSRLARRGGGGVHVPVPRDEARRRWTSRRFSTPCGTAPRRSGDGVCRYCFRRTCERRVSACLAACRLELGSRLAPDVARRVPLVLRGAAAGRRDAERATGSAMRRGPSRALRRPGSGPCTGRGPWWAATSRRRALSHPGGRAGARDRPHRMRGPGASLPASLFPGRHGMMGPYATAGEIAGELARGLLAPLRRPGASRLTGTARITRGHRGWRRKLPVAWGLPDTPRQPEAAVFAATSPHAPASTQREVGA